MNDYEYQIFQSKLDVAVEQEEYNLVSLLKPKIYPDGNQWCVLYGNNIVEGVVGFGDTPYKAVLEFNKAWNKTLLKENKDEN